jgi:hypothetical protein
VFIYLMSVVPAIWFLELHELNKRISRLHTTSNLTTIAQKILAGEGLENNTIVEKEEELSAQLGSVLGVSM